MIRLLLRKGTSPRLMRAILFRYVLCYFLILPFYLTYIFTFVIYRFETQGVTDALERYWMAIELSMLICGFIQTMIRLCCEPFVLQTFKDIFADLLCMITCRKNAHRRTGSNAPPELFF